MAHNLNMQQEQQLVMDEMMEQILSMPSSWNESSGGGRWDYSGVSGLESMVALLNTNNNSNNNVTSIDPETSQLLDGSQHLKQEHDQSELNEISGSFRMSKSLSYGRGVHLDEPASDSAWQYGSISALDELTEAQMFGKRLRDEQQQQQQQAASLMENLSAISAQDGGIFSGYVAPRAAASKPASQGGGRTGGEAQEAPAASAGAAAARPRVRARRGQATDPHSIAERLRRERIAERMKSLQELVPNSNKTDKASMLDEIIDYVKFLQLQVKVLSMSRLGNAGAVMSDLPAEDSTKFLAALGQTGGAAALQDGISLTERQVAKLMEEDMGSAMQYLQSKGLCLMPIHLASNMSKSKTGPSSSTSAGNKSSSANKSSSSSAVLKTGEDKVKPTY